MEKRKQLENIFSRGTGERELVAFLKENPVILLETPMSVLGHPMFLFHEFPLGPEYKKADFVIVAPYSGAFDIIFIEVEPPTEKIFNKDGVLAKRANKAFEQVSSWKDHVRKHRTEVLETVDRYGKEKDLYQGPQEKLTCTAGLSIFDPVVHVSFSYVILMGRRDDLSTEMLGRKSAFKENSGVEIITCDRLFDIADKIDANPEIYT